MTNFLDYDEYYENYYLPEYDTAPSRYSNIRPNVEPASRNADRSQNQRGGTLAWASRGGGTWGTSPPPPLARWWVKVVLFSTTEAVVR